MRLLSIRRCFVVAVVLFLIQCCMRRLWRYFLCCHCNVLDMVVLSVLFSNCWSLYSGLMSIPTLLLFSAIVSCCPSFRINSVWILRNIVLLRGLILEFLCLSVGLICWLRLFSLYSADSVLWDGMSQPYRFFLINFRLLFTGFVTFVFQFC